MSLQYKHFDEKLLVQKKIATGGLLEFREVLIESYLLDLIDIEDFTLMYENNQSRSVFPYWKFNRFDLDAWDDSECYTELRKKK